MADEDSSIQAIKSEGGEQKRAAVTTNMAKLAAAILCGKQGNRPTLWPTTRTRQAAHVPRLVPPRASCLASGLAWEICAAFLQFRSPRPRIKVHGMADPLTSEGTLVCSACHELVEAKYFTSNQIKKGSERRCAMCLRGERETSESERAGSFSSATTMAPWGITSEGAPQVAVGDKFEVWLPQGTISHDRRAWVARRTDTQEWLPNRLPFTAPYYASRVTELEGTWVSVHVTSKGGLQAMGQLQKPALDEMTLPASLRGPPPAAGAARTGETYAGAVTSRPAGPTDRRITVTVFAPKKATTVYLEEVGGPGRIDLGKLSTYCWQTVTRAPCPAYPANMTFKIVAETPGRFYGSNSYKSIEYRVNGRTYSSPMHEGFVFFSNGVDDEDQQESSPSSRAGDMVHALLSDIDNNRPTAATVQTIDSVVQCSNADFSGLVNALLSGNRAPPCCFVLPIIYAWLPTLTALPTVSLALRSWTHKPPSANPHWHCRQLCFALY